MKKEVRDQKARDLLDIIAHQFFKLENQKEYYYRSNQVEEYERLHKIMYDLITVLSI